MQLKHIIQGIAVAMTGAVSWLFWFAWLHYNGPHRLFTASVTAAFGLPLSAVFLVPVGVALGIVLPEIARKYRRFIALFISALVGIFITAVASLLVTLVFKTSLPFTFRTMLPVCTLLLCFWTTLLQRSCKAQPQLLIDEK